MNEKTWKKIERAIADDPVYRIKTAGTTVIDDEPGFEINLVKMCDYPEDEPKKEKVKIEPLRCKLSLHSYGEWRKVEPTLYGAIAGRGIQTRECILCKRVDKREL